MIELKVVTPRGVYTDLDCQSVHLKSSEGEFTILPHHMPIITDVVPCRLVVKTDGGDTLEYAMSTGFMQFADDKMLILADAITYAITREKACKVVDIATLTGAMARMLGGVAAGVMANDEAFYASLQSAAERSGEKFWRAPDYPEYKKLIESPVADLYNSSDGCGAIAAGLFLAAFAGETPWLHLDIAGTAWSGKLSQPYQPKGATGMGAATLYQLCRLLGEKG